MKTQTFSLGTEIDKRLEEIKERTRIKKSELLRIFIDYFYEDPEALKKLIFGNIDLIKSKEIIKKTEVKN